MDFTRSLYERLVNSLKSIGYYFQTFESFLTAPLEKVVTLRHDVDRLPDNALKMAMLEHELGLLASYYFRATSESWDEGVIRRVSKLGHEVGYHYESLSTCKGNTEQAFSDFIGNLEKLRTIAPVKTISMHGSPLSRINNLDLWKNHDYKSLGIIGEPYLDVDYRKVFYITDTGRRWNNSRTSIRDRVESGFNIPIRSTYHLITLAEQGLLPDQMIISVHPQRWHDRLLPWSRELLFQNIKNILKYILVRHRPSLLK